jgi:antibiotic biosynthesis monooxygenase (ABM) superfamily enzyme
VILILLICCHNTISNLKRFAMSKCKRIKKRWVILFTLIALISVVGLFVKESAGQFDMPPASLYANVAWLITATIFVLMMTPGLSFFMAVWFEPRTSFQQCYRAL